MWTTLARTHNQESRAISTHMIRRFTNVPDTSSIGPPSNILEARLLVFMAPRMRTTPTRTSSTLPWPNITSNTLRPRW
ncbi:hypothetical protein ACHAPT_007168 [Fusarium lateritium]